MARHPAMASLVPTWGGPWMPARGHQVMEERLQEALDLSIASAREAARSIVCKSMFMSFTGQSTGLFFVARKSTP